MKKLLMALAYCPIAFAQVSKVEIKNFNFSYKAPRGEGVAETFSYQKSRMLSSQKISVEKIGEDFKIDLDGVENQEFIFSKPPSVILDAQTIKLSSFNFLFSDKVNIDLKSADFHSSENNLELDKFTLSCNRMMTFKEVKDQVISGCVQKMNMKADSFISDGGSRIEHAFIKAIDETFDEFKSKVKVEDIKLSIINEKLDLSAQIDAQISGKGTGTGTVKYNASTKKVTIKISEFKFGILGVTGRVFDELEKMENDTLKVDKPYIYITVK